MSVKLKRPVTGKTLDELLRDWQAFLVPMERALQYRLGQAVKSVFPPSESVQIAVAKCNGGPLQPGYGTCAHPRL